MEGRTLGPGGIWQQGIVHKRENSADTSSGIFPQKCLRAVKAENTEHF